MRHCDETFFGETKLKVWRFLLVVGLAVIAGCGEQSEEMSEPKAEGVVGTTCYVQPIIRDNFGSNVCLWPKGNWPGNPQGEMFYAGVINAFNAQDQALRACQEANGLDYGAKFESGGCYAKCKTALSCIPFTNK